MVCQPRAKHESQRGERGRTRVELVERDAELAEAWEELRLNFATDGIVRTLIDGGLDIPIGLANLNDLRNLPPGNT